MDSHIVHFYEDDDAAFSNLLLSFIDPYLRRGDACLVISTMPHRAALEAGLRARGICGESAELRVCGTYAALDAAEILAQFMVDDSPDERRFSKVVGSIIERAAENGNGRVRLFGEMVGLLFARGKPEAAIHLERLWNRIAQTHSFSLICSYPARALSMAQYRNALHLICAEHSGTGLP